MTFSISLPTTQFFPDVTPPARVATEHRLQPLPLGARAACACAAALISSALIGSVAWGISAPDGDATGTMVAMASVRHASGSR